MASTRIAQGCGEHPGPADSLKQLGDKPVVIEFASGGAKIEVAGGLSIAPW